jgi:endonuclease G
MLHRITPLAVGLMAFLAAASSATAAPTNCPDNFLGGQAPDLVNAGLARSSTALCYTEFGVLFSGLTRTPLWSADHLTADRVAQAAHQRRSDASESFHEETALPPGDRSWLRDFSRSGYDRGHLSPNADMSTHSAQGESFTLANMVPQWPENNRGIWEGVEGSTRALASQYGEVWVVTVPIFAGGQTQWLHDRVAIPSKIAKAVYIPAINTSSAYITDNGPGDSWQAISVAQLRDMSGIDPFPALPESVKQAAVQLPEPKQHYSHGGARAEASPGGQAAQGPVGATTYGQPHWSVGTAMYLLKSLLR